MLKLYYKRQIYCESNIFEGGVMKKQIELKLAVKVKKIGSGNNLLAQNSVKNEYWKSGVATPFTMEGLRQGIECGDSSEIRTLARKEINKAAIAEHFCRGMMTGEIAWDIWEIFSYYIMHHADKLVCFDELNIYKHYSLYKTGGEIALAERLLGIICKAAVEVSDRYSVELIKYIYKVYHKKEYNRLKRYTYLTPEDIFSLSDERSEWPAEANVARVFCMAQFFDIKIDSKCELVGKALGMNVLTDVEEETDTDGYESFEEGELEEAAILLAELEQEARDAGEEMQLYGVDKEAETFVSQCYKLYGYRENYTSVCGVDWGKAPEMMLVFTVALLRRILPDEKITFSLACKYNSLHRLAKTVMYTNKMYYYSVTRMLGLDKWINGSCKFEADKVMYDKNMDELREKDTGKGRVVPDSEDEAAYIKEIQELRMLLSRKEKEISAYREEQREQDIKLKGLSVLNEKYKEELAADREELIALREYAYSLSERDIVIEPDRLEVMKAYIANCSIVIVGGHVNWVNKLRTEFPKWRYCEAGITRINAGMILEGADKLYFFTDCLCHSTYNKYVSVVRERNIPFGYIHTVNMEYLVKMVYDDMIYEEGKRK